MEKDWKWGCIGFFPGIVVGSVIIKHLNAVGELTGWLAIATLVGLASLLGTGLLVAMNRRSLSKLSAADRPAQLTVRPIHAVIETPELTLVMFGAFALGNLVLSGEFRGWQSALIVSSVWGYVMALTKTAYVGPS